MAKCKVRGCQRTGLRTYGGLCPVHLDQWEAAWDYNARVDQFYDFRNRLNAVMDAMDILTEPVQPVTVRRRKKKRKGRS